MYYIYSSKECDYARKLFGNPLSSYLLISK